MTWLDPFSLGCAAVGAVVGWAIAPWMPPWGTRWIARRTATAPAINVVNGIVLPMPDDPRWEQQKPKTDIRAIQAACGPVVVWRSIGATRNIEINGEAMFPGRNDKREAAYVDAVLDAFDARLARETLARQAKAVDEFMGTGR